MECHWARPGRKPVRAAGRAHRSISAITLRVSVTGIRNQDGNFCRATDLSHRVKKSYEKMLLPFETVRPGVKKHCFCTAHQPCLRIGGALALAVTFCQRHCAAACLQALEKGNPQEAALSAGPHSFKGVKGLKLAGSKIDKVALATDIRMMASACTACAWHNMRVSQGAFCFACRAQSAGAGPRQGIAARRWLGSASW